jgi:hypothetical protein
MTRNPETGLPGGTQVQPDWTDPDLPPDQFLYERLGPWPQPAPAYPMSRPPEVLNIPPIEALIWNENIGARYLKTQLGYAGAAAALAVGDMAKPLPTDDDFLQIMTRAVYARFLRRESPGSPYWVSDFTAMELITPLPGTYCAPVVCRFFQQNNRFYCVSITFLKTGTHSELLVTPGDKAWNLAKVYACQGAAYHALFVVHPALHFPMDSVNAITKTAVPHIHPLFQALYPHTTYTLQLDNAVLESAFTVVNNNAPGTWFDPLTAGGYNIKQLFGVGYAGYKSLAAYPAYNYMTPWMDGDTLYGQCLREYFKPFLVFAAKIASVIPKTDPYVQRWADYCSAHVRGFPDGTAIFAGNNLATVMAIYMWDVTVSHGADHHSFGNFIQLKNKFLRIRRPPPANINDGVDVRLVSDVTSADDMARAELANAMFFSVWTLAPNLIDTIYPFTDPTLQAAAAEFHTNLKSVDVSVRAMMPEFMRLEPDTDATNPYPYNLTIPASIQF